MKNITKSFPGVQALNNINFNVRSASVCALVGENGAGKSTLVKILAGIYAPDSGHIYLKGKQLNHISIKDAIDAGISMIHQELAYIPYMTIMENLFLGKEPTYRLFGYINKKELYKRTEDILSMIEVKLKPNQIMKDLSVAERQMVEIAKAISHRSDIIIMDEPTAAISDKEIERLFIIINDLKDKGVAIIYISHKIDEILRISDDVCILRDGIVVGAYETKNLDNDTLVPLMVGRKLEKGFPTRDINIKDEIFSVNNLTKKDVFKDISFNVRRGEILGIAGLMGAGRTEVVNCIFGIDTYDSGDIVIKGKKVYIKSPGDAIKLGIGLVSEDRKGTGLVLLLTVRENLTLSSLSSYSYGQIINKKKERIIVDKKISELSIKTSSREQWVENLSGGNQQKVVIGKSLLCQPDILILDEPTRGIDVGAKSEIYKIINQLASEGRAVIIISSELAELMGMSDRVVILHEGKKTGELKRNEFSQEKIMRFAFGN